MARRRSPVARPAAASVPSSSPAADASPSQTLAVRSRALAALALDVLTVAAYGPAFRAGFIWDDDDYVTDNATLESLDGLSRIWLEPGAVAQYYPLTFTSLWLEH